MPLGEVVADQERRQAVAADAVAEVARALADRRGAGARAAQLGLATIHQLRPGFLERHVNILLPAWADALSPFWDRTDGAPCGRDALIERAPEAAAALLVVTDNHVDAANDTMAVSVYRQLRPRAPQRISDEMPRIATFIEKWTP